MSGSLRQAFPPIRILWGLLWRATLLFPVVVAVAIFLIVASIAVPMLLLGACWFASVGLWWESVASFAGGVTLGFLLYYVYRRLLNWSPEFPGGGYV